MYNLELQPNGEMPSLIQFQNTKVVDIEDFELKKPTEKEIEAAQKKLTLEQ